VYLADEIGARRELAGVAGGLLEVACRRDDLAAGIDADAGHLFVLVGLLCEAQPARDGHCAPVLEVDRAMRQVNASAVEGGNLEWADGVLWALVWAGVLHDDLDVVASYRKAALQLPHEGLAIRHPSGPELGEPHDGAPVLSVRAVGFASLEGHPVAVSLLGLYVLHDSVVVEIEVRGEIAVLGALTSSRDDLDATADAERGELADALPPHDRPLLLARGGALVCVLTAVTPHVEVEAPCFLGSHAMPVVLDLDGVAVVGHRPIGVLAGQLGAQGKADAHVFGVGVVAVGEQLGYDRAGLVIELDAELVDGERRDAEAITVWHSGRRAREEADPTWSRGGPARL